MFVEPLDAYLHDFGIPATVGGVACRGVFDSAYADALGIAAGTQPVLTIKTSAAPTVAQGQTVTLSHGRYIVAAVEPDGTGMTRLRLETP